MRTLVIATLTCLLPLPSIAQENMDPEIMVGFACFYEGKPTKPVVKVAKLLKAKHYEGIARLLTSGNSGEKYLAVITLERLSDNGQYNLSESERELIEKARLSNELVSVCSGCTDFYKIPMKEILKEGSFIGAEHWLNRVLNKD